ncbi:MAG: lipoyl(octanoyl) transferase LipB [Sphingobacteriaceae bacterium]
MKNKKVFFQDWGIVDYQEAWENQGKLFNEVVQLKTNIRNMDISERSVEVKTPNYLVFCEHPNVYTLGKSGKSAHLLLNTKELLEKKAAYYPINRGGDITFHGPGQLVAYPILDLDNFFTDIHLYLRKLEEAVILVLNDFGLKGERYHGLTGVWLDAQNPLTARKICAMGVRCSRWITMHGLALNVNTQLDYFNYIIPCGITDKAVTSMQAELGHMLDMEQVKKSLRKHIFSLFEML